MLLLLDNQTGLNETCTLLYSCMNLNDAVELLRIVSAIPVKKSAKHPEIRIIHAAGNGYTLRIEKSSDDADYRNNLNIIIESCKLAIHESEHHLIIYGNST